MVTVQNFDSVFPCVSLAAEVNLTYCPSVPETDMTAGLLFFHEMAVNKACACFHPHCPGLEEGCIDEPDIASTSLPTVIEPVVNHIQLFRVYVMDVLLYIMIGLGFSQGCLLLQGCSRKHMTDKEIKGFMILIFVLGQHYQDSKLHRGPSTVPVHDPEWIQDLETAALKESFDFHKYITDHNVHNTVDDLGIHSQYVAAQADQALHPPSPVTGNATDSLSDAIDALLLEIAYQNMTGEIPFWVPSKSYASPELISELELYEDYVRALACFDLVSELPVHAIAAFDLCHEDPIQAFLGLEDWRAFLYGTNLVLGNLPWLPLMWGSLPEMTTLRNCPLVHVSQNESACLPSAQDTSPTIWLTGRLLGGALATSKKRPAAALSADTDDNTSSPSDDVCTETCPYVEDGVACDVPPRTGRVRYIVEGVAFCKRHAKMSRGICVRASPGVGVCPYVVNATSNSLCGKKRHQKAVTDGCMYCKFHAALVDGVPAHRPRGNSAPMKSFWMRPRLWGKCTRYSAERKMPVP